MSTIKKKKITGGIDYLDEIEYPVSEDTKMYSCVERLQPERKEAPVFPKLRSDRGCSKVRITGDPES